MLPAMSWIVALLACGPTPPEPVGDLAEGGQRAQIAEITFNLWTDYIPLLGALDPERCTWLEPAVHDDSTPWPPLQAFWIIHDDPSDVNADVIGDTYFVDDQLTAGDFPARAGLDPLGFKYFTGFQQSLLELEAMRRPEPGVIEADFGSPVDATVRIEAGEGCAISTTYCRRIDGPCDDLAPLSRIHMELGATFFNVLDVRFE